MITLMMERSTSLEEKIGGDILFEVTSDNHDPDLVNFCNPPVSLSEEFMAERAKMCYLRLYPDATNVQVKRAKSEQTNNTEK